MEQNLISSESTKLQTEKANWNSSAFQRRGGLVSTQYTRCMKAKLKRSGISLNLRTVVTSWSYCSRVKWRIDYLNDHSHHFKALRHIFKTFDEAYTIFLSGERIGSDIGSVSWNTQHILWLISTFKQRDVGKILVGFQGRWTSIYYFFESQIFYEVLDIFPRLTFIMLNVGIVDNLEFW